MPISATRFLGNWFGAFALLLASFPAPLRAFADAGEVLQTDQGMWMRHDNRFRDAVISLQFQPSLSPTQGKHTPLCGASAFFLQAFLEPGVVVSFRPDAFAGIEPASVGQRGSRCQVTLPNIYPYHRRQHVGSWLRYLQFQGDQQVKLLVGCVVPEFGGSNRGTVVDQGHMWLIALVRDDDPPLQRQHAHLLPWLEGVVVAIVVGDGGREI